MLIHLVGADEMRPYQIRLMQPHQSDLAPLRPTLSVARRASAIDPAAPRVRQPHRVMPVRDVDQPGCSQGPPKPSPTAQTNRAYIAPIT